MSTNQYTADFFTAEHSKFLGDLSPEKYHQLVAKYTTKVNPETIDVKSETFKEELKSALEQDKMVFVSGVMQTTEDGTMEKNAEFRTVLNCVKEVAPEGKSYIHIDGPNKTAYPHPKFLEMLEKGKYSLEGGFWAPGERMPEQTIIAEKKGEVVQLTTCLMCSVYSNFNKIKTAGVTPRTLGCSHFIVPKEMMEVEILSAEHAIQIVKAVAAVAFPAKYMNMNADDTQVAKAMATFEKIKNGAEPIEEEKETLKRKLLSNKEETISTHCKNVLNLLETTGQFDVQKKLGQLPTLTGLWFDKVKGIPIEKYRDFDAEDLEKLGANAVLQAFALMLRIHGGDQELMHRLLSDIETDNVSVESAIHDPVKNTDKKAEFKFLFTGLFPDRVWGKFSGCPRYTAMPDGLVHSDGQPQVGHLGNGGELVRMAIKGDKNVLKYFGLEEPLAEDGMQKGAAAALEKFWIMVGN
jgi:hypothetical protein